MDIKQTKRKRYEPRETYIAKELSDRKSAAFRNITDFLACVFHFEVTGKGSKIKTMEFLHFDKRSERSSKLRATALTTGPGFFINGDTVRERTVGQTTGSGEDINVLVDEIYNLKRSLGLNGAILTGER